MSELTVGTISGLAANDYVVGVADGSLLTQPGMILQSLSLTKTNTYSESLGPFTQSPSNIPGLELSITPKFSSSKILITAVVHLSRSDGQGYADYRVNRNGTNIGIGDAAGSRNTSSASTHIISSNGVNIYPLVFNYLDSPSTTSLLTYGIKLFNGDTGTTLGFNVNRSSVDSDTSAYARTISTITLMEIAQ